MNNDKELFELCKEVYEKTKLGSKYPDWVRLDGMKLVYISRGQYKLINWSSDLVMGERWGDWLVPLYTSDYLLEKLKPFLKSEHKTLSFRFSDGTFWLDADDIYNGPRLSVIQSDTPLKALLKLVIALDDAGVKL